MTSKWIHVLNCHVANPIKAKTIRNMVSLGNGHTVAATRKHGCLAIVSKILKKNEKKLHQMPGTNVGGCVVIQQ